MFNETHCLVAGELKKSLFRARALIMNYAGRSERSLDFRASPSIIGLAVSRIAGCIRQEAHRLAIFAADYRNLLNERIAIAEERCFTSL
jgi:hypothetical protein